jgi:hypothetical protein
MASRPSPLLDLGKRRRELASLFSWAVPTDAALDLIAKYARCSSVARGRLLARAAWRAWRLCNRIRPPRVAAVD